VHEAFDEAMIEIRRNLATLHFQARDQCLETPAFCPNSVLRNVDEAVSELGVQLNALEDLFRELCAPAKPGSPS
jgi:hypothetical protein